MLSFGNNRCLLLLNKFLVVHLAFPGRDSPVETRDCFTLDLPPQVLEQVTDTHFCRGLLFLLDSAGWICILCSRDIC